MKKTAVVGNAGMCCKIEGLEGLQIQDRESRQSLDPIAVIHEDHERQIRLCDALSAVVNELVTGDQPALVLSALSLFRVEIPRHIRDEEESLFPILEKRLSTDVDCSRLLAQLRSEHRFDNDLADFILEDLAVLEKGHALPNPTRLNINLRAFAEALRRHTAWEEATVLKLASEKLTRADMDQLRREMVARRLNLN